MAEYNIQSGGMSYRVEAENEQAAKAAVGQRQFTNAGLWFFYFIFSIIPRLCVKLFGYIFGLLFAAGKVGKIIQTVIVAIGGLVLDMMLLVFPLSEAGLPDAIGFTVFLLVPAALLTLWYWRDHYDTVKFMTPSAFSKLLTLCFTICLYGCLVGFSIGFVTGAKELGLVIWGFDVPFVVALAVWFIKTRKYARPKADIAGWTAAAEAGDANAQYNLAVSYYDGYGVWEDKAKSFELYKKSAEGGNADAQYCMGLVYATGQFGEAQDTSKAREWFQKAADQGCEPAKKDLAELAAG